MNNQNQEQKTVPELTPEQKPKPKPKPKLPNWVSILIIVIAAIIVVGLVSWAGYELFKPAPSKLPEAGDVEDEFKDWETYQNEEYEWEIQYPEGLYTKINGLRLIISDLKEMGTQDVLPQEKIHIIISVSKKSLYQELYSYILNLVGDASKISITMINDLEGFKVEPGKYPAISIFIGQDEQVYHLYGINYQNETLDSDNFKLMYQILSTFKFIETEISANWKTYQNEEYGFEVKYPEDWKVILVENPFNMTICKGDCFEKDNIQMVEGIPNFVSRGSIDANTNYLKEVIKEGFNKLEEISITGGKGFYGISETKGGPSPSAYLIGKDRVFLIGYNIWTGELTSEIEELFNQILSTFKFTD